MLEHRIGLGVEEGRAVLDRGLARSVDGDVGERPVRAQRRDAAGAGREGQAAAAGLDLADVAVLLQVDQAEAEGRIHVEGVEIAPVAADLGIVLLGHDQEPALGQDDLAGRVQGLGVVGGHNVGAVATRAARPVGLGRRRRRSCRGSAPGSPCSRRWPCPCTAWCRRRGSRPSRRRDRGTRARGCRPSAGWLPAGSASDGLPGCPARHLRAPGRQPVRRARQR